MTNLFLISLCVVTNVFIAHPTRYSEDGKDILAVWTSETQTNIQTIATIGYMDGGTNPVKLLSWPVE